MTSTPTTHNSFCLGHAQGTAREDLQDQGRFAGLGEAEIWELVDAEAAYYLESGLIACSCSDYAQRS